jgi:hypothetical protein
MRVFLITILCICTTILSAQDFTINSIRPFDQDDNDSSETGPDNWFKIDSISLYGGGSLLGLVTSADDRDETASPSGSIGLNFASTRLSCNLYFSYNGRQDIEMNSLDRFGTTLMNPNTAGQSLSFTVLGSLHKNFGFSTGLLVVDNLWQLDSLTTLDASPFLLRIGGYVKPFEFPLPNNIVNFTLNFHYTHRSILGDFGNNPQLIGTQMIERRGYNGIDISANI